MSTSRDVAAERLAVFGMTVGGATVAAAALAAIDRLPGTTARGSHLSVGQAVSLAALGGAVALLCAQRSSRRPVRARYLAGPLAGLGGLLGAGLLLADINRGSLAVDQLAVVLLGVGLALAAWRPKGARLAAWLGGAALIVTGAAASELGRPSGKLFGLVDASEVALPAVILLGVVAIGLQIAISERAGAVRHLWGERSLRARLLRTSVLPLPAIAIGPIIAATVLVGHRHPGEGRDVAELGTVLVAMMVLVNAWVSRRAASGITEPLRTMSDIAERIADGDLDTPVVKAGGQDEIAQLAAALDRMRLDLRSQARVRLVAGEASALAADAAELAKAFESFVDRLGRETGFDRATYYRPTGQGDYRLEAIAGPRPGQLPVGMIMAAEAVERPALGFGSALTFPTFAAGKVRAVFGFASNRPDAFGPAEDALLGRAVREAAAVFEMLAHLDRERASVERLEDIDRQKNEFVGMVAHDLRSPMSVVAGFAETLRLRWDVLTPDQREEFLGTISRNILGLSSMVEDMLDVALIESGDYSCSIVPFPLDDLVRRTTTEVAQSFGNRETVLATATGSDGSDRLPLANADEQRIWQVLTNLLSNAYKFSPPECAVAVRLGLDAGELRVEVADQGRGIAAADHGRVFDKFARLPGPAGGRRTKGTGLGLYICKLLVEAQGGRIGVDSAPAQGSTFWFTVPAVLQRPGRATSPAAGAAIAPAASSAAGPAASPAAGPAASPAAGSTASPTAAGSAL